MRKKNPGEGRGWGLSMDVRNGSYVREPNGSFFTIALLAAVALCLTLVVVTGYLALRPKAKSSSITGSIWLNDGTGRSDLQRGAMIFLVPGHISAGDLRKLAGKKMAEINRRAAAASDNSGIGDDANALGAAAAAVKSPIGVQDALDLLNREPWGRYSITTEADFGEVAARSTRADVNGVYRFDGVPPGLYYVLASPGPVHLNEIVVVEKGQAIRQDLHN